MTTSITFHLRPSQGAGRKAGKLFIRVIRNRRTMHITRDYSVYADEWDAEKKRIILSRNERDMDKINRLSLIDELMKNDLKRLQEIVSLLEEHGDYSSADVVERFADSQSSNTVLGYAAIAAKRLREQGCDRTARAYRSTACSLTDFTGGKDVLLSQIDGVFTAEYEQYLLSKGLALNTVSFYLRNLRALYFRAVTEKIISRQYANPFHGMHTGVYETRRRALNNQQIKALAKLDEALSEQRKNGGRICELCDSLRYFMFCYHARGMSFVDMAHLRKQDVGDESLTYRRRKTGGLLEIKITQPMRKILSDFEERTKGSEFVFPIIDSSVGKYWLQYETGLKRQNRSLKILGRMAGIAENLSTHAARHTWATLAKRMHVPVAIIGEALGHRDVKTTSIYLASFDRSTMDKLSIRLSAAVNI